MLLSIKYQKRWCLVYGNYFLYYDSPDDKAQKGSFSLEGYRFLPCPGSAQYGFSLVSKHKRPFEFIAPDYDSYVSWEHTVKKGISLTGRKTGPVRIVTDTTHDTNGPKYSNQPKYPEKCLTLPIRELQPRPKLSMSVYGSSPNSNMNKGNSNLLSAIRKDNLKCSIVGGESKIAETISKSFSDSNTDSDEDDNGYIQTSRLNCPVMTRNVDTNSNISKEASVCKNYTEDDYMMVLGNPETNDVCVNDEHSTYSTIDQSENKKDKLEKIYSSVKKPGDIQYTWTNESASCSQRSSSDDSEADYANPDSIIDYSQVIQPGEGGSLPRISCDYVKVDNILPTRMHKDSSSSSSTSSSYDSDDSNDDTQIHNYENPNYLYYNHKDSHINSHVDQTGSHPLAQHNSDTCDSSSEETINHIPSKEPIYENLKQL